MMARDAVPVVGLPLPKAAKTRGVREAMSKATAVMTATTMGMEALPSLLVDATLTVEDGVDDHGGKNRGQWSEKQQDQEC